MAEHNRQTKLNKEVPDVPWLRLWEEKLRTPKTDFDQETRLANIEFMNMLEELEFH